MGFKLGIILGMLLNLLYLESGLPGQALAQPVRIAIHSQQLQFKFGEPIIIGVSASNLTEFNIRTIPPSLAAEIEKNPAMLNVIGNAAWTRLREVSRQVEENGLTGISAGWGDTL